MGAIFQVPAGMPASIFRDKYARKKTNGSFQTWEERMREVVEGNLCLAPPHAEGNAFHPIYKQQRADLLRLGLQGVIPFSGRHLQHGDHEQCDKIAELFANCSTAMFSWAVFLLLMKGCGVGRDYSSGLCFVDWDFLPNCRFVLSGPDKMGKGGHPDYEPWIESLEEAHNKYDTESEGVRWFEVADSAEGWARVVMVLETAAFHKRNKDTLFVFDFSNVRPAGAPLKGQQGRPASGPVPFIRALHRVMSLKGAGMKPWKQALYIDHYLAACVVVGGVRRSARMAIKSCRDRDVIEFIDAKRGGFLWSANNAIAVDAAFWADARKPQPSHARRVFEAAMSAAYWDDTGEPNWFNVDLVNEFLDNLDSVTADTYISSEFVDRLGGIHQRTKEMIGYHLDKAKKHWYKFIPNPCGEVPLAIWGAYCFIGDLAPFFADTTDDILTAARRLAEAMVRINTMACMYRAEVRRTNRIGVSLTGIHEFMWKHFQLDFRQALGVRNADHSYTLSSAAIAFWRFVEAIRDAAEHAANAESRRCGLPAPATVTIVKPSGTVAKVLFVTEGAHLPPTRHFLRWVALVKGSDAVREHKELGYPVKDVSHQYADTVVVGFPTCLPFIEDLPADLLVTAPEASVEEQYRWLELLEKHWLGENRRNGQVSYTLKWRKTDTSYEDYIRLVLEHQPRIRACAMMPELEQDASAYAYVPEEPISRERYFEIVNQINRGRRIEFEAYDSDALRCAGGACPIEENIHYGDESSEAATRTSA